MTLFYIHKWGIPSQLTKTRAQLLISILRLFPPCMPFPRIQQFISQSQVFSHTLPPRSSTLPSTLLSPLRTLPDPSHKIISFQYDDMLGPYNTSLFPYYYCHCSPLLLFLFPCCPHIVIIVPHISQLLLLLCPYIIIVMSALIIL